MPGTTSFLPILVLVMTGIAVAVTDGCKPDRVGSPELRIEMARFSAIAFPTVTFVLTLHDDDSRVLGLQGEQFRLYEDGAPLDFLTPPLDSALGNRQSISRRTFSFHEVPDGYEFSHQSSNPKG